LGERGSGDVERGSVERRGVDEHAGVAQDVYPVIRFQVLKFEDEDECLERIGLEVLLVRRAGNEPIVEKAIFESGYRKFSHCAKI
jgi:hypothetical protein